MISYVVASSIEQARILAGHAPTLHPWEKAADLLEAYAVTLPENPQHIYAVVHGEVPVFSVAEVPNGK
jgi:hypothetical protein